MATNAVTRSSPTQGHPELGLDPGLGPVDHAARRAILEGPLRPGEAIPIADLALDLGLSPDLVHDALPRLCNQGLVMLPPARTAVVAPVDLRELHEIYRLRWQIEVDAAARAAASLSDADLSAIEDIFEML